MVFSEAMSHLHSVAKVWNLVELWWFIPTANLVSLSKTSPLAHAPLCQAPVESLSCVTEVRGISKGYTWLRDLCKHFDSIFLVFTLIWIKRLGRRDKNWECQKFILSFCYIRGNISACLGYFPMQQPRTNLICKHLYTSEIQSKIYSGFVPIC